MRRASRLNEMKFKIVLQREHKKVRALVDKAFRTLEDVGGTASRGVSIPRVRITEADPYYDKVMGFINASLNRKGQVDVSTYTDLLGRDITPKRLHFTLTVLDHDLTHRTTNFVFGSTLPLILNSGKIDPDVSGLSFMPSVTVSLHRLKMWYGQKWAVAFSTLLIHELGHFYGLTAESNPSAIFNSGTIRDGHCSVGSCVMEQVNVPGSPDLITKAKSIDRSNPFCNHDRATLVRNLGKMGL
jgi:predicted Zn-dependent protease